MVHGTGLVDSMFYRTSRLTRQILAGGAVVVFLLTGAPVLGTTQDRTVDTDGRAAIRLLAYLHGAAQGDASAQYILGMVFESGRDSLGPLGVPEDPGRGARCGTGAGKPLRALPRNRVRGVEERRHGQDPNPG